MCVKQDAVPACRWQALKEAQSPESGCCDYKNNSNGKHLFYTFSLICLNFQVIHIYSVVLILI